MKVIDATNLILGRLASHVAKLALMGEEVVIINCEKAIVSGDRLSLFKHYLHKRQRGSVTKGPYFPKQPDRLVRRTIRGMLPRETARGREAFKRVMCYLGVPIQLADQRIESVSGAEASKLSTAKYITVKQLSDRLGANG